MKHLLNCRECDWHRVIEGPSMLADVAREEHGDSIRYWRTESSELCNMDSIAWVRLREDNDE